MHLRVAPSLHGGQGSGTGAFDTSYRDLHPPPGMKFCPQNMCNYYRVKQTGLPEKSFRATADVLYTTKSMFPELELAHVCTDLKLHHGRLSSASDRLPT